MVYVREWEWKWQTCVAYSRSTGRGRYQSDACIALVCRIPIDQCIDVLASFVNYNFDFSYDLLRRFVLSSSSAFSSVLFSFVRSATYSFLSGFFSAPPSDRTLRHALLVTRFLGHLPGLPIRGRSIAGLDATRH
jgi:hypothetical protein